MFFFFFLMKIFPAETFLPKVQMKYVVEPKFLPRNVEMERRRRVYKNLKIEDALKAEGVKSRDMLPFGKICQLLSCEEKYDLCSNASYLPLELFDDEDYDCRWKLCDMRQISHLFYVQMLFWNKIMRAFFLSKSAFVKVC